MFSLARESGSGRCIPEMRAQLILGGIRVSLHPLFTKIPATRNAILNGVDVDTATGHKLQQTRSKSVGSEKDIILDSLALQDIAHAW